MCRPCTVSGFSIRGFSGFGVGATAASGTVFKDNVMTDNRDAGLFAAQSLDTRMLSNRASGSRFGVLTTGAVGGTVAANSLPDNRVRTFDDLADYRLTANRVNRNTRV